MLLLTVTVLEEKQRRKWLDLQQGFLEFKRFFAGYKKLMEKKMLKLIGWKRSLKACSVLPMLRQRN